MSNKIPWLLESTNFSQFGKNLDIDEPIEFAHDDPGLADAFKEDYFPFLFKALPKDRYRVLALILFTKKEMGYQYTYSDIASIWGFSQEDVLQTIKRMRGELKKKGFKL